MKNLENNKNPGIDEINKILNNDFLRYKVIDLRITKKDFIIYSKLLLNNLDSLVLLNPDNSKLKIIIFFSTA